MPPMRISGSARARVRAIHLLAGERQHRLEEADRGIANGELRRVHADRQAAGSGRGVVARQRALPALVEPAVAVKGQRMRGNDPAVLKRRANAGREACSSESAAARFEVRRLAETVAAAPHPVGGPSDQPRDVDARLRREAPSRARRCSAARRRPRCR